MSLYAEFLQEYCGDQMIESTKGFVQFRYLNEKQVYIVNIYVRPEFRNAKEASFLADEVARVAKDKGCVEMLGTVVPSMKSATQSLQVLLGYGMKLKSSAEDLIVFVKEL